MRTIWMTSLSLLTVCMVGLGAPSRAVAADCETLLNTNLYKCPLRVQGGASTSYCFQFVPGSPGDFHLVVNGSITLACSCQAGGNVTDPKFDVKKEFQCFNPDAALTGKVSGNGEKIKQGQGLNTSPTNNSFVYECEQVTTCP